MRKIKSKLIALLAIIVFSLVGCSTINGSEGGSSFGNDNKIPDNGIIMAQTFKKIKDSGEMAIFQGQNKEFSYEWMFLPTDIKESKDINLLVNSIDSKVEDIKKECDSKIVYGFSFGEAKSLDSKVALSLIFKDKLDCTAADIYQYNGDELKKVTTATVDNSSGTTFNFSIQERKGDFYIVGSDPKQAAIDEDSDENGFSSNDSKSEQEQKSLALKEQLGINVDPGKPNEDGKDKYLTDPTPAGKPKPFEWNENGNEVDKSKVAGYVTLSIDCKTLLKPANRKVAIENGKGDMIPKNGIIYKTKKVKFYKNETVFDVLLREVKANKIHMEFSMTPIYNSNYIEGIHNLYEFDGGELSGWMYQVNGWYPNYGCSRYKLKNGDVIKWRYTCDLGQDVGCDWMSNKK